MADYSKDKKEIKAQIKQNESLLATAAEIGSKALEKTATAAITGLTALLNITKQNEKDRD